MSEAPSSLVLLQPGQVIQDFEIVKPLGKGKFSIVYMAKRLSDGLMCALKKINIFDMMVPKQREKCLKEVRLLQSLNHTNIVKLLTSFIDDNELFIIVEWAEKGDLKRLIRRASSNGTNFKESDIWEYSKQLTGALDHMHKKRIMHRDLKPANIFVSLNGSLKLGDLGLGRFFSSQTLEAFSKVGTPLYMSPEVLHGAGYDMRSDVWSLGCVVYELAMLRSPFKSDQQLSLYDLFVRISKGQYPPLPETLSAEFRALVDHMLQISPAKRPDCAQVMEVCCAQIDAAKAAAGQSAQPQAASRTACRAPPLLVMDDIVEKLKLLECEERLLWPRGFPILHRCFFTQLAAAAPGQRHTQFEVMCALIQWLLGMLRAHEDQAPAADASAGPSIAPSRKVPVTSDVGAGDAAAGGGAPHGPGGLQLGGCGPHKADPAQLVHGIVDDLRGRGIQASSDATLSQLRQGYGESVCIILNELINQELLARDFHFQTPLWGRMPQEEPVEDVDEEVEEEEGLSEGTAPGEGSAEAGEEPLDCTANSCIIEAPSCRAAPWPEPVHTGQVDTEAWGREVDRVRPLLRLVLGTPDAASGWRSTIMRAKQYSLDVCRRELPSFIHRSMRVCHKRWRDELARLRGHEDSLNAAFSQSIAGLARLHDGAVAERGRLTALQSSITDLSRRLAATVQEADAAKGRLASQQEALHDTERLTCLKAALQRLQREERELGVRVHCLQSEILTQTARRQARRQRA